MAEDLLFNIYATHTRGISLTPIAAHFGTLAIEEIAAYKNIGF